MNKMFIIPYKAGCFDHLIFLNLTGREVLSEVLHKQLLFSVVLNCVNYIIFEMIYEW